MVHSSKLKNISIVSNIKEPHRVRQPYLELLLLGATLMLLLWAIYAVVGGIDMHGVKKIMPPISKSTKQSTKKVVEEVEREANQMASSLSEMLPKNQRKNNHNRRPR